MKIRGPQLKYFAAVMAVIAIVAGIWMTFFQSRGFVKTTATIVSVVEQEDAEAHGKLGNLVPATGFYRIRTRETDLSLLFVALLALARTNAADGEGGSYGLFFPKKDEKDS